MGWMHDTLQFFARDPAWRRWHQDDLTFAMLYEGDEAFLMPLSHDEVVHGKGALLAKMPGDVWQRFANLRLLLAYQYTRPGKKLLFMGTELAPWEEWSHDQALLQPDDSGPLRQGFHGFVAALGRLYRERSPLWRHDHDGQGFEWIDHHDHESSVLSYLRKDGPWLTAVVLNLTPVPRDGYRVGLPRGGTWRLVLDSDAEAWGGSGYLGHERFVADGVPWHGRPCSIQVDLPPLAAVVLEPVGDA
ncbi:MAG: alpha amylase C-terminal domain-containing protein [Planctomycetota bacterium]